MTKSEVKGLMAVLEVAYPQTFVKLDTAHLSAMTALYAEAFAADDGRLVMAAVKAIISGDGREFAPNIGMIKARMRDMLEPESLGEGQAWALVSQACRNGIYGYRKEFDRLPTDVKAVVGSPEQIRAWAVMDRETLESVVASNFMRAYRTTCRRREWRDALPDSVKGMVAALGEKMALAGKLGDGRKA